MTEATPLQQTVNLIRKSEKILLLTHAKADGDGLSACLALANIVEKLGKKPVVATADGAPYMLQFLPGIEQMGTSVSGTNDLVLSLPLGERESPHVTSHIEDGKLKIVVQAAQPFVEQDLSFESGAADYDLIITCDTPELPMLGRLFEINPDLFFEVPLVNIDHHASNAGYGRVNVLDITAASTTEIITRIARTLEAEDGVQLMDADLATLLLTGIITDTGSFQHANTTPRSYEVAADLIAQGARHQEIIHHVYKTKQLTTLKLWGRVLSKIQHDDSHKLVWSTVTKKDLDDCEAHDEETGDIIDELMTNAPGAEVVLLLKQNGDGVRASLRTTTPAVSASDIASMWGGGGHLQAAGFKVVGKTVEEIEHEVVEQIRGYQNERLGIDGSHDMATPKSKLAAAMDSKK